MEVKEGLSNYWNKPGNPNTIRDKNIEVSINCVFKFIRFSDRLVNINHIKLIYKKEHRKIFIIVIDFGNKESYYEEFDKKEERDERFEIIVKTLGENKGFVGLL